MRIDPEVAKGCPDQYLVDLDWLLSPGLPQPFTMMVALRSLPGSLAREDYMDCVVRCPACGSRFELLCETYHGRGGRCRWLNHRA